MKKGRGCLASCRAANALADILLYSYEQEELKMANRKTTKKKQKQKEKKDAEALRYVNEKLTGGQK